MTLTTISGVTAIFEVNGNEKVVGEAFTWGVTGEYVVVVKADVGNGNFVFYNVIVSAVI